MQITDTNQAGRFHLVEALVLPKITSNTPAYHVSLQGKCKHLSGLSLADPKYGTPGSVDLLLGADVFSRVVLHGGRFGPVETPSAFNTQFGRVLLTGSTGSSTRSGNGSCYLALTGMPQVIDDEL